MKRARYKFEDKIWAVRNAKGKNLSDSVAAREATEHLKEKEPDFTGEVSINVFRGWKRLKWESNMSHECMSSKKKLVYKYPFLETGLLHFLKLLTDPSRTGNYKKVKYTCAAVKRAAIQVKNGTLLVLQKSLWWKDLMEGSLPKGAREGIEKIERFGASDKWCIRMLESIMKEERLKENCLSFVQFKNLQIGAEMFQECLGSAVLKVLEDMHLDTTTLLPLKDAKQVERLGELRYLKWNGLVINFSELRAIQDTGRMCSSTMYLYCAEMARRGNEKKNGLWVMPPSLLCAVLDVDASLACMRIEEIVTKTGIEADFQLTKARDAEKLLYPLPRVSQGGFNEENGDWCLVLVDKSRKEARYFEARRAADFKCLKFKSAADMCVVLTHKLRKQKNKVIRKKDMKGYRHFHNQIGEHPLQQIHSFRVSANGLFVCKVVEWICTKGNPRTETYQEDILNYGKVIQRVVVEVCLNKKIQW